VTDDGPISRPSWTPKVVLTALLHVQAVELTTRDSNVTAIATG
jgi:hypothetical protein